ncbi:MAG: hypothetical protein PVJ33_04595 [Lysobacterales bacterium]|jgi:hypothetical protein
MMNIMLSAACIVLLVSAGPLPADVTESGDDYFTVRHTFVTGAEPATVYQRMKAIGEWWNPEHSWSGEASNLYMDARRGGCFCERLPDGGGVEHLRIIYLAPGREIRFEGALGPLQPMAVNGRMTWSIEAADEGSSVTFIYRASGHADGGLGRISPAVDNVIGEQARRLEERLSLD